MTRSDLHELVDKIPETEIDHIAILVRAVREGNRPRIAALTAPPVGGEEMGVTSRNGNFCTLRARQEITFTVPWRRGMIWTRGERGRAAGEIRGAVPAFG